MRESGAARAPSYSARLVLPFVSVLRDSGRLAPEVLAPFERLDEDARIPIVDAHRSLEFAAKFLEDPQLGLRAAQRFGRGDVGTADYFWGSGATVRDAFEKASTSTRLLNDALHIRLEEAGDRAVIRLESTFPLPPVAVDYMVAGFFRAHVRFWLGDELASVVTSFVRAAPADDREYRRTFAPASVRFDATFEGFVFERALLERPLPTADPKLHSVMKKAAEALLAGLPRADSVTDRVRGLIAEELADGNPSAVNIALRLGMSERTLARRLGREGTAFKTLLDDSRRHLASAMVEHGEIDLAEIARRLGFSQTAAFHRAFRRWTGHTPLEHRARAAWWPGNRGNPRVDSRSG